jgi:exopolyphosphatase/guanosine-5'-triphosphate,3'-diphosphate pyrophosphatase
VIKCHARGAIDPKAVRLRRDGDKAMLQFSPAWADGNPRTLHLLREEADAWQRQGPLRLLLPG